MMDMFIIFIALTVSSMSTYVKMYQIVHSKYVYNTVYCILIIPPINLLSFFKIQYPCSSAYYERCCFMCIALIPTSHVHASCPSVMLHHYLLCSKNHSHATMTQYPGLLYRADFIP